jgi:phosphoglycerate kinase
MKTIDNYDFTGKKAIIRVDFNVPINEKLEVADDTRIKAALPTIKKILSSGGVTILMSHLGRPKGEYEEKFSLKNIVSRLSELVETEVKFAQDCVGEKTSKIVNELKPGDVLLLENLRFHKEEKNGEETFAKNWLILQMYM